MESKEVPSHAINLASTLGLGLFFGTRVKKDAPAPLHILRLTDMTMEGRKATIIAFRRD